MYIHDKYQSIKFYTCTKVAQPQTEVQFEVGVSIIIVKISLLLPTLLLLYYLLSIYAEKIQLQGPYYGYQSEFFGVMAI